MVKVFRDKKTGDVLVQSNCLDAGAFLCDLAEVLPQIGKDATDFHAVLQAAMPIAYKLSGYKADEVTEQRTLVCGRCSPQESSLVAESGK